MYSGQIVPIIPNPDYLVTILRILFFSLAPHLYSRNTLEQFWGFWGSKYHWNIRLIPGGLEVAPSISYLLVEVQDTGCNWLVYRFITLGFGDIYNPLIEVITLVTGGKRFGRYEFVPDLRKKSIGGGLSHPSNLLFSCWREDPGNLDPNSGQQEKSCNL